MSVDDPIRRQWERIRPRTAEEWTSDQVDEPAELPTPRPDPTSLHAGAMPMHQPEPEDPIRAWLNR